MKSRCAFDGCKRRLTITDMACKCERRYCIYHRLPMDHQCPTLEKERTEHQEYLKNTLQSAKYSKLEHV